MRTTLPGTLLVGIIAATFTLAGCGDDGGDPPVDAPVVDIDAPVVNIDAATGLPDATPNNEPTAAFTISPNCTNTPQDQITFTSTSTDPDGDPLSCSWTFNSGSPSSASECEVTGVTFPDVAPYNVTLIVNDGRGGENSSLMSIGPC